MGKQIVIVGASSGIGFEMARQCLEQGYNVVGISRNEGLLATLPGVEWIQKDVVNDGLTAEELPSVIDGLVYCPGSIVLKPFRSISAAQFTDDFAINVLGAVNAVKASLEGLKKATSPSSVVLFSTVAVQQGMPFHASIAASKGAVEGLTRSLAAEFAPSIRVNCIAPSLTDTPLAGKLLSSEDKKEAAGQRHPLKRVGNPSEIAGLGSFLLSDNATWITGQVIHADGGLSSLKL